MSGIGIVSPGYPDTPGGVTDHTARLVGHWSATNPVRVCTAREGDARAIIRGWRAQGITALLLQYVPFLYGRRGLSRFPLAMVRAARAAGLRSTVFVHEPWVPLTRLPWLVVGPLQRRQLHTLVAAADACVTAVPAWRASLGPNVTLVAVGSTLGAPGAAGGPPLAAPLVFSPLAAGLNWDWIVPAVRAIAAAPAAIVVGATREEARRHLRTAAVDDAAWDWRGRLPATEVLGLLSRAPLVLAPFTDGITARRTSVLAALSTGTRVITSRGPLFDSVFKDGPALADDPREFTAIAAQSWRTPDAPAHRTARRAWYDARFDPARLDARLLELVMRERA